MPHQRFQCFVMVLNKEINHSLIQIVKSTDFAISTFTCDGGGGGIKKSQFSSVLRFHFLSIKSVFSWVKKKTASGKNVKSILSFSHCVFKNIFLRGVKES